MAAPIIVGMLALLVDGEQYIIEGSFAINPGTDKAEPKVGEDGSVAHSLERRAGSISGNVRDHVGLDVLKLLKLGHGGEDVTVQADLRNGKSWVLAEAVQSGEGDIDPKEGTVAVAFTGRPLTVIQ